MDRLLARKIIFLASICTASLFLSGCKSFSLWGSDDEDERIEQMTKTDDVKGPLERMLSKAKGTKENQETIPGYYDRGREEFARAQRLIQSSRFVEAEGELKDILDTYENYAVREDALFYLGEAYFNQKKYPKAQDAFDELVKDFPSTKYQRQISKRMFSIAGIWLDFPDVVTPSDIKLASNISDSTKTEVKPHERDSWDPTISVPFLPNVHDRSRPAFDTEGRALQALKSIWLNDPGSDLADDALMMTASHHLRKGSNVQADEYFAALRQQYPNSPHFKNAYILGSHVKLMAYEGDQYDGTRLEEAKQLKESAMRLWPENKFSGHLKTELDKIEQEKAAREWAKVEFYLKKGRKDSAAVYCREILRLYPDSSFASKARRYLKENPSASRPKPNPQPVEPDAKTNWDAFPKLDKIPKVKKPSLDSIPGVNRLPGFGGDGDKDKAEPSPKEPDEYDPVGRVSF